ncbi:DUF2339 domain-containing protein [Paenibacillus koleovorans]|uniref:DUF2339 domain-containing protein n=1 Tax=Paenibacillus koleovorans TaxID=121608 RepID=UPI0013E3910E|nr:DUF2339 domain-containing protein [Paenibacillus koleovorans]
MQTLLFRKHWTSFLGVLFVLAAFITLFRYSLDQNWITNPIKIGAGLLCGFGLSLGGIAASLRLGQRTVGDILIGLGACLLYATFSFSGIFFDLWSPLTVLLCMTAVTVLLAVWAYQYNSRIVMNLAIIGGLLSPLLMRPETDQVFTLFLYLFVVNAAFFFLSISKGWSELRSASFIGTWLIYCVYFLHFNPTTEGIWTMPVRYATAAFVFYLIGFLFASWKNNRAFDGWNLYLSLVNGVLFSCWTLYLLDGDVPMGALLAIIGLAFTITGAIVFKASPASLTYSFTHGIGGVLLMLIAAGQLGDGMASKPLINVFVWSLVAMALAALARWKNWKLADAAAIAIWAIVGTYWYAVTWTTPRGEWFGVYIPFLNWGAVSWMLLAATGFYFSLYRSFRFGDQYVDRFMTHVYALLAHLVVGGLLTVQIVNAYEEYATGNYDTLMDLTLSCVWGVYALLLFLWGSYYKQVVFVGFGSLVLVAVGVKAIFLDLDGEQAIYKIVTLLVLGALSFAISLIRNKWTAPPATEEKSDQAQIRP